MTAIFFSKYIIQTSQTGIVNVVFNHVVCSAREKITNPVCCVYDTAHIFFNTVYQFRYSYYIETRHVTGLE